MITILIAVFVLTYVAIALEHPLRINKAASSLLGAGILWSVYAIASGDAEVVNEELAESLVSTAEIAFFLMGAMTIVEVIDTHKGFNVVTSRIRTQSLPTLMWIICLVTFFLSAILDNLTTTIVMVSLLKKLLEHRNDRLFFAGMIVIAANAGGAWSPIGDVTTTMLWIGGQITALQIIEALIIPSLINLAVPLLVTTWMLRGKVVVPALMEESAGSITTVVERNIMFFMGLGVLTAVPAFKTITHLPPFLGVLLGLGLLWLIGDFLHRNKTADERRELDLTTALSKIDIASIVFFIGILLAVATLEHTNVLASVAAWLDDAVGRLDIIIMLIGLVSAIVDNVPLVAASMGMYNLEQYPTDSFIWEFLAYCAGTGGSILIIGSAAGIAAMGIEKINFVWYVRNMSVLAFLGYISGALVYIFMNIS